MAVVAIDAGDRHDLKFVDYVKKTESILEIAKPFKVLGFTPNKKWVALQFESDAIKIFDWAQKKKVSEFVTADNKAKERRVSVGVRQGKRVQIISGLQEGDKVITSGGLGLEDKAKVAIQQPKVEDEDEDKNSDDEAKPDPAKPDAAKKDDKGKK